MEEYNLVNFIKFINSVDSLSDEELEKKCANWYIYFDYKQYQYMARSSYAIRIYGSPKKASDYYYNKKVVIRLILAKRKLHPKWAKLESGYTASTLAFNDTMNEFHNLKTPRIYTPEELNKIPYPTDSPRTLHDEGFEKFIQMSSYIPKEKFPHVIFQWEKYYRNRLIKAIKNDKENNRMLGSPKIDIAFCKTRLTALVELRKKIYYQI